MDGTLPHWSENLVTFIRKKSNRAAAKCSKENDKQRLVDLNTEYSRLEINDVVLVTKREEVLAEKNTILDKVHALEAQKAAYEEAIAEIRAVLFQ